MLASHGFDCRVIYAKTAQVSIKTEQARLAQSVARETLNLKVVGSSPTSGLAVFFLSFQNPHTYRGRGDIEK